MCITTPGKILKITGNKATVKINDEIADVRIDLIKGAKIGDLVYCTSGMAVEKVEQ